VQAQLRKRVFKKGSLQASLNHDFRYKNTSVQLGFQYNFQYANAAISSNIDNNGVSFTQSASGGLMFEPNADFVEFNNNTSIGRASVKFVPYLDINGNGKRDFDEQPVKGLEVVMNGGRKILDQNEGTTIITGLEPYIKNYITFDTSKVNNIAWRLENKTLNITLNPNQLRTIEIPISVVGEVAGMVQRSEKEQLTGIAGLKINIYKNDTDFIASVLSESDGYFNYLGLTSGNYSAKIDSTQLQKLHFRTEAKNTDFIIDNGSDGAYVDNLEFILYQE
jgi:outer membrane usher protein FimD/PapC